MVIIKIIHIPVKIITLFGLLPHSSIKWTQSPNLKEGWPANTTQGVRNSWLKVSSKDGENNYLIIIIMTLFKDRWLIWKILKYFT